MVENVGAFGANGLVSIEFENINFKITPKRRRNLNTEAMTCVIIKFN
jgi:hypothetical protein